MTNELAASQRDDLADAMKAHVSRACRGSTDAEVAAFVAVCRAMGLNPILGEVHAMRDKAGTLRAVPSIDGWVRVIRTQPDFRGVEFAEHRDEDGSLVAITCTMHVEGWRTPCVITEYLSECRRRTDPWQSMPTRMLRHRALIQCGRVAFGYVAQLAFYRALVAQACDQTLPVHLIAVEKREPFRCGVWQLSLRVLDKAAEQKNAAIRQLVGCRAADSWPTGFESLRLYDRD